MIKLRNLSWLFVTIVVSISINGTVFAQSAEQVREYQSGVYFYNDGILNKCPGDGGATYTATEIKNIQGMYKSGLTQPYILEQFMIGILKRMAQISGKPESDFVTQEHVLALVTFAIGEGGDIANRSVFNPMNGGMNPSWIGQTGSVWGGSGSDGRRGYASFDIGVELYARQFFTGNQSRIGAVLSDPSSTAQNFMYTLTYYSTYKGNLMWATASLPPNDKKYYQSRLALVEQVRKSYPAYGGIVIGTDKFEQKEGIYRKDLLTYKSMTGSGGTVSATTQPATTTGSAAPDYSKISDVSAANKKNIPIIWAFLVGKGLTEEQAAGVMGNVYQESRFQVDLDDPPAYGLFQWQGDRLTRLKTFAQSRGKSVNDIDIQLAFFWAEMQGGYKTSTLDPLKKTTSIGDAVDVFDRNFEQQGHYDVEIPLRTKWANEVFAAMHGVTSAPAPGSSCAPTSGTQPTNGDFVFYSQNDPKWGSDKYNGSGGSDIDSAGCGLTSYSMIAATFKKDKAITPKSLAKDSFTENVSITGYRGETMAKWGATKFGLPYQRLSNNAAAIRDALNSGAMVISGGGGGPYRFDSHIIVLRSIDSNNKVLVADPEDNSPKDRYYDLSDFISHGQYFVAVKNAQ